MDLGLKGARALITGGSKGIGFFTAQELVREGASVAICARDQGGLDEAAATLRGMGGTVYTESLDLMDGDALKRFTANAVANLGGLDILIHNASGLSGSGEEGWHKNFEIDIMAGIRAIEVAQPALEASGKGSILFIGSTASVQWFGRAGSYGPMKAAQRVVANELGQTLGRKGIRVNALSPGATWMEGRSWDRVKNDNPALYEAAVKGIPFRRLGTGEEVARVITFTVSPAASWINGTHVIVDGGQHIGVA